MKISEEQLKQLVLRILTELEAEGKTGENPKVYMVCETFWDERYGDFLREMEQIKGYGVCPVISDSWQKDGHEEFLRSFKSCVGITYHSRRIPLDLETAVTVFPVVSRDLLVKTALCISDTFETAWTAACLKEGSRAVFLQTGLERFSGREQPAYKNQILAYYRRVLEYGIEICHGRDLWNPKEYITLQQETSLPDSGKKRVITSSTVEQYASDGVLFLQQGDIVTEMAKDRAKFLNIVFQ